MMGMTCNRVKHGRVAEAYLLGAVDEATRGSFELHILDCATCLDELETLQALQLELEAARGTIESVASETPRRPVRMWAMGLAAAAMLAVASTLLMGPPATPDRTGIAMVELVELADLRPARYTPVRLRGSENESAERFRAAMGHYLAGDFAVAATGLRQAVELDPQAPKPGFYLGVSLLLTGDTDGAIESLGHTVALGDSLYIEWAHLYLAKAHLLAGDMEAARAELERILALQGDLESEAERMLGGLPAPQTGGD
jgi:tetratricopeptide (TPR) repeat protein